MTFHEPARRHPRRLGSHRRARRGENGLLPRRPLALLESLRGGDPAGYTLNPYDHSLQAATRALRAGESTEMVVCILFHDAADRLAPANHGQIAAEILRPFVSDHHYWMVGCTACSRRRTSRVTPTGAPASSTRCSSRTGSPGVRADAALLPGLRRPVVRPRLRLLDPSTTSCPRSARSSTGRTRSRPDPQVRRSKDPGWAAAGELGRQRDARLGRQRDALAQKVDFRVVSRKRNDRRGGDVGYGGFHGGGASVISKNPGHGHVPADPRPDIVPHGWNHPEVSVSARPSSRGLGSTGMDRKPDGRACLPARGRAGSKFRFISRKRNDRRSGYGGCGRGATVIRRTLTPTPAPTSFRMVGTIRILSIVGQSPAFRSIAELADLFEGGELIHEPNFLLVGEIKDLVVKQSATFPKMVIREGDFPDEFPRFQFHRPKPGSVIGRRFRAAGTLINSTLIGPQTLDIRRSIMWISVYYSVSYDGRSGIDGSIICRGFVPIIASQEKDGGDQTENMLFHGSDD